MDSFSLDISKFISGTNKKFDAVFRSICLGISTKIIKRTPVDTGRAKANWQPTISSPANAALVATDKSGSATVANVATAVGSMSAQVSGDMNFYLTNNVPYIYRLENGWSQQAPSGMVRISIAEFPGVVADAANSVSGGIS